MAAIGGLLSTTTGASTNELVSEFQTGILTRNARGLNVGTTLFGLMSRLSNENAENNTYNWFERDPVTRIVYSKGATASNVTDSGLLFDDNAGASVYGILQVGVVIKNIRTGEAMRITQVTANATDVACNVERNFDAPPAFINDNDSWVVLTMGKDEGADPAISVFETASTLTNYVQTFNASVYLTNAFKGTKLRTDIAGPLQERRIQALERICRDIEFAYFFGKPAVKAGTNGSIYYTGGIKAAVDASAGASTNVLNGGDTSGTSLANVQNWLQSFLTVGSDSKILLAGPKTYAAFSNYANSGTNGFRITGQENVFGMNVTTINTPFGALDLAMHPLFKEVSEYADWGFVVDLAMIVQKVMEPMFLEPNIQTPGKDAYQEQFRAKYGLKMKFSTAFGYCYDFSKIT